MVSQLLACASMEPTKAVIDQALMAGNDSKVLALKEWRLLGRLSAKSAKESWLTKLEWNHNVSADALVFSTSLGGVVATLAYVDNTIIFAASDGVKREVALSVQEEVRYSAESRVFYQSGWRVELGRFELLDGVILPAKVVVSKNNLTMKIVVDQWLK